MNTNMYRVLPASEAAIQPIPYYVSQNYGELFKIQRVRNAFPLRPVSFSSLTSYLECPGCALDQKRRKRPKEPKHFTHQHQTSLFGSSRPDPRLVGTLLHQVINVLHDTRGPLTDEQRCELLASPEKFVRFIRRDLLQMLQAAQKLKLAMFLDELSANEWTLRKEIITPLLQYQRELALNGSEVFAVAERFQFKLASTRNTFTGHTDWGGEVAIVGEFDQIRLRHVSTDYGPDGKPAIIEFKAGLGKKKSWDLSASDLEDGDDYGESGNDGGEREEDTTEKCVQPGMVHALQLAIYWMAFQTRWDILERLRSAKGRGEDVHMSFQQDLDLILYNLHDGCQYQLLFTDFAQALQALTNCVFHLNWSMKSGYAWQAPEHECGKTALLTAVPVRQVQVGTDCISAEECYLLAREAFQQFKEAIIWHKLETEA